MQQEPWEAGPAWLAWVLDKIGMSEDEAAPRIQMEDASPRRTTRRP